MRGRGVGRRRMRKKDEEDDKEEGGLGNFGNHVILEQLTLPSIKKHKPIVGPRQDDCAHPEQTGEKSTKGQLKQTWMKSLDARYTLLHTCILSASPALFGENS
jgi:hypothetical protein